MSYQVLARKWRPKDFEELIGQEHVSQTLLNGIRAGRIPHALLLTGPRGTGKTSTILAVARELFGTRFKSMTLEVYIYIIHVTVSNVYTTAKRF